MLKALLVPASLLGLTSAVLVALPGLRQEEPSPGPEPNSPPALPEPGVPAAGAPRAGAVLAPVPAALAAQLGLPEGVGALVESVVPGSPAAAAGLAAYDVVVSVDGEPLRLPAAEDLASHPGGAVLRVIRGGEPRQVPLALPGVGGAFLSSSDLSADHPFRRFGELVALRASWSAEVERHGEYLKALDQESRSLREEARREIDALQRGAQEEVAAYFAEAEARLLGLVGERLRDERSQRLSELAVDPESVLPGERMAAVGERLEAAQTLLAEGLRERLTVAAEEGVEKEAKRAEQRLGQVTAESARLIQERILKPRSEAVQEAQRLAQRQARHAERVDCVRQAVAAIRTEVGKRITCAGERTRDALAKALHQKLEDLEVPRPGEMEAAVADVRAQMEDMTRRFLSRTEGALLRYESEVKTANERLSGELATCLSHAEASSERLGAGLEEIVRRHVGEGGLRLGPGWRDEARLTDLTHALRADLIGLVNRERDTSRAAANGIARAVRDHGEATEEAWCDLQKLLGELKQEAANDCWKLDGPHLDGRFPDGQEDGGKPRGGEVAFGGR